MGQRDVCMFPPWNVQREASVPVGYRANAVLLDADADILDFTSMFIDHSAFNVNLFLSIYHRAEDQHDSDEIDFLHDVSLID